MEEIAEQELFADSYNGGPDMKYGSKALIWVLQPPTWLISISFQHAFSAKIFARSFGLVIYLAFAQINVSE